jgi:hypothetical protein
LAEDREQDGGEDRDYRDHHQQFNEREADPKTTFKVALPNDQRPKSVPSQHLTSLLVFAPFGAGMVWHFHFSALSPLCQGGKGILPSGVALFVPPSFFTFPSEGR